MGEASAIEWTDATWNPTTGCDRVSRGCDNCYIERTIPFRTEGRKFDERGKMGVRLHPDRLDKPLHWRKPRRVFVDSLSDLFHANVPTEFIERVFITMLQSPQHTFQVLTKRPQRMLSVLQWMTGEGGWTCLSLPNVWLGVSVENQQYADLRIPYLLRTPAAVRFLSCEPLLGPVDLSAPLGLDSSINVHGIPGARWVPYAPAQLDWVIIGGESGPGARPMHPDWARSLRDQCAAASVPFFFKQWGEWREVDRLDARGAHVLRVDGRLRRFSEGPPDDDEVVMAKLGKKTAGRLLDGREWNEMPEVARV